MEKDEKEPKMLERRKSRRKIEKNGGGKIGREAKPGVMARS